MVNKRQNSKQGKRNARKQTRRPRNGGSAIAGAIYAGGGAVVTTPSMDTLRTTMRGAVQISNGATGAATSYFSLAFDNSSGIYNLSSALASLAGHYRHWRLRRVVIRVFGTTSLTGGGYVAAAYDPNPSVTAPGALQEVTNHVHSVVVPVGEVGEVVVPFSALPQEFKKSATAVSDETNSCGVIQLYGINAAAATTPSIMAEVLFDIEFKGFS